MTINRAHKSSLSVLLQVPISSTVAFICGNLDFFGFKVCFRALPTDRGRESFQAEYLLFINSNLYVPWCN